MTTGMASAMALVTALSASADSAALHPPSPERIAILNEQFVQARWVDVATDAGVFHVNEPRALGEGLAYRRRSGDAPVRRAIFSTVREMPAPLQNPIPWSRVESVTWRHSGAGPGAIGGGIVGGLVAAGLIGIAHIDAEPDWPALLMFGVGAVGAGAGLGGLFGGMVETRQVLYHAPGSSTAGSRDSGADPGAFAQRGRHAVMITAETATPDSLRFSPR